MSQLRIKLGQAISFGLGRQPVEEVFASDAHLSFEDDKTIPQFDDDGKEIDPKIIQGRAVLTWHVSDKAGPAAHSAHPVSLRLSEKETKWLRDVMENKTQAVLAEDARTARGGK